MTTSAADFLGAKGISMDLAHEVLMSFVAQGNLQTILTVAHNLYITNAMLGEIAAWPGAAFPASLVIGYFGAHGLDSTGLDPAPGDGGGGGYEPPIYGDLLADMDAQLLGVHPAWDA